MANEYFEATAAALALVYFAYEGITYQLARNERGMPGEVSALMRTGPITGFFYSQPRLKEMKAEKEARNKA